MKRLMIALLAALALAAPPALAPLAALAQQAVNYDAVQIKTTDLGHRTWMLEGQGGNMTAIVGDDGVILVDTEFASLHDKIKAALAALSDKPVRYVVDTHLHGDHTGGNQAFWGEGAVLVGQQELTRSMAAGTTNALTGAKTPPAPKAAIPTRTYDKSMTLAVRGRRIELIHMPHSHTKGDTAVWIPDANVLATGDIVSTGGRYPNIDVGDGGGIDGMISSVDAYLRRANARTQIVPGHGALMDRPGLLAYRVLLTDARAAVVKQRAAGKTEDQAVAARPLADVQRRAGANDQASDNFVRLIYRSAK